MLSLPLAEIPKDAEHTSQGFFERLACGLVKTHQITEGSTLGWLLLQHGLHANEKKLRVTPGQIFDLGLADLQT